MARRLNPSFKKFWGDELITEEKEDAVLAAIYRHPKLPALPWRHTADRAWTLPTPYGTLKIWADIGKFRLGERHGALLIHC